MSAWENLSFSVPGRQKKLLGCGLLEGISNLADSMANALLPKVRKYSLTHSNLFDSQLNYGNLVWGQNRNTIKLLFFRKRDEDQ